MSEHDAREIIQRKREARVSVGLNSVRCEILSPITIVSYDKVRGRNKTH